MTDLRDLGSRRSALFPSPRPFQGISVACRKGRLTSEPYRRQRLLSASARDKPKRECRINQIRYNRDMMWHSCNLQCGGMFHYEIVRQTGAQKGTIRHGKLESSQPVTPTGRSGTVSKHHYAGIVKTITIVDSYHSNIPHPASWIWGSKEWL